MPEFFSAQAINSFHGAIVDCRFSLADTGQGRKEYALGHIPTARYLDLAQDMSAPVGAHGGRHPLPSPQDFASALAALGIGLNTRVVLYDDSRFVFAARCWWMMRALGYREPAFLNGGYAAWLAQGGVADASTPVVQVVVAPSFPDQWPGCCNKEQLAVLQGESATLVDAREAQRYRGEHEPIDPIAGHIPGALNLPWQTFSDTTGRVMDLESQRASWGETLNAAPLVLYCGSGVSACVNLLSLAMLGRDDAYLYSGSWSDWCSYL